MYLKDRIRGCNGQNLATQVSLPATPHSPKPELSIVEPLLRSATASSALLNNFEAWRSIFGGGVTFFSMYAAVKPCELRILDGLIGYFVDLRCNAIFVRGRRGAMTARAKHNVGPPYEAILAKINLTEK